MNLSDIKIDPEFRDKIPPLTEDEFKQLRENILADGEVREPLVVWNGVILDGHNRFKVLQEHPEIPFRVKEKDFPDKWAASEWIYRNQLGRRNLTSEEREKIIGEMYKSRKKSQGLNNRYSQIKTTNPQNEDLYTDGRTSTAISKELGIGRASVERAEQFANGVDALNEIDPDVAKKVLKGKSGVPKCIIRSVHKMDESEKAAVVEWIRNPPPKKPKPPKKDSTPKVDIQQMVAALKADKPQSPDYDFTFDVKLRLENAMRDAKNMIVSHSTELTTERRQKIIAALSEAETAIAEMKGLVKP